MPAVEHELLGAEPGQARLFVEDAGVGHQLVPVAGRVDVDLDDARVGRDHQALQAPVARRLVAFQDDGKFPASAAQDSMAASSSR
jgi:ABC-type taurine transport system ATPase subunit